MKNHTPGPWFAKQDPNSITRDDWVIGIEGGPIDEVAVCSKRDARLISAAPDLLEALRMMMREYECLRYMQEERWPAAAAAARAAIEKATK